MSHEHHAHGEQEEEENSRGKVIRLVISAVFFFVLLFLEHVAKVPFMGNRIVNTLLYLIPYLLSGYGIIKEALEGIVHGEYLDENFLMFIASAGAFFVGENAEAAAVFLFYSAGELFEDYAVGKSHDSIQKLLDIAPKSANLAKENGETTAVDPYVLKTGDTIVVLPGERIPVDSLVLEGRSYIDTSAITGEPVPVKTSEGDHVISGCVNGEGTLRCRVEKVYTDSTISRVMKLTEEAAERKSGTESFITRFARWYTPVVVGAAVLLAVIPPLLFKAPFSVWLKRACSFLVISCPCALVVSVPLSFFAGLGTASRHGVLVKGSVFLEALSRLRILATDKTGTLTKGEFRVTKKLPAPGITEKELLAAAVTAESLSDHPIALSIQKESDENMARADLAENVTGKGILAKSGSSVIAAGNAALMEQVKAGPVPEENAGTVVYVAKDGRFLGTIVISDTVKEEAAEAIADLRSLGVKQVVLLTGDNEKAAGQVKEQLGLDAVYSSLLPQDKLSKLEELLLSSAEGTVGYTGDGINDAPVLKRADVGISMGALGSDAAIEAADVVIMDDDFGKVPVAVRIGKATMRIARQNIVFALFVKGLFLALGAMGITGMWLAVFADVGVAVLCILNSMRMLTWKK